jgi:hypothetical protein
MTTICGRLGLNDGFYLEGEENYNKTLMISGAWNSTLVQKARSLLGKMVVATGEDGKIGFTVSDIREAGPDDDCGYQTEEEGSKRQV